MSKDRPVRVELSHAELFEAAFFIGYATARLTSDGTGQAIQDMHGRAKRILEVLINATAVEEEAEPVITVEGLGVEGTPRRR